MNRAAKHLDLLDQVRGVAIISVLLFHMVGPMLAYGILPWSGWFPDFRSAPPGYAWLFPLIYGQAGVAIFFIISGFCIHLSFRQSSQGWRAFFIRRFFRIYPAYIAAVIFFILLEYAKNFSANLLDSGIWVQLLSHVYFVHNLQPSTFKELNGSFWSLAVEVQLYLLYPLLLVLVGKLGWRRTLIALAVCEVLIRGVAGQFVQSPGNLAFRMDRFLWLLANSPLAYWFSWSLGAFIADAYLEKRRLPFLKFPWAWCLALALASHFLKPLYPFRFLLFALTTAMVLSRLLDRGSSAAKRAAFPLRILAKFGLFSYSIYLLHEPFFVLDGYVVTWLFPDLKHTPLLDVLLSASALLVSLPLSYIWYQLFELPGISYGKRFLQQRALGSAAGADPVAPRSWRSGISPRALGLATIGLAIVLGTLWVKISSAPRNPDENNALAWSYATNPDPARRNGPAAIRLAESACRQTQYHQTDMIATLAAAYAEAGRFDQSVTVTLRACQVAETNGETNALQINRERLQLYENHHPYHEPAANASP